MRVPFPGSGAFGALSAWSSFDTLLQRLDITTDPNFWDGLQSLIPYQDYFLESQYHDLEEGCETPTPNPPNLPNQQNPTNTPNPECLCANSPFYAYEIHGIECTEYRLLYWYHPDYLGHNEFITDNRGLPYQYFHYSAFGETLVEDNAHYGQFSSPYRFNAKELDQETGNYYYGARYYNPTWSVWLGVDPLANHPNQIDKSPYAFSWNNPIRLIDLDGRCPECEEIYSDPVIGLIHESSGGQIYQYSETRDENGNVTGAAWTGLGGTLKEAEAVAQMSDGGAVKNGKHNKRIDQASAIDATLGIVGGVGEVLVGIGGELFTAGLSTAILLDGAYRIGTNTAKLGVALSGDQALANAIPTNFGGLIGKIIDGYQGANILDVGIYQSSLGLANDIGVLITPAGNAGAIRAMAQSPSLWNGVGLVGSYYGSTYGAYNNAKSLNDNYERW